MRMHLVCVHTSLVHPEPYSHQTLNHTRTARQLQVKKLVIWALKINVSALAFTAKRAGVY